MRENPARTAPTSYLANVARRAATAGRTPVRDHHEINDAIPCITPHYTDRKTSPSGCGTLTTQTLTTRCKILVGAASVLIVWSGYRLLRHRRRSRNVMEFHWGATPESDAFFDRNPKFLNVFLR